MTDALSEAVAKAEADLDREVWTAVRITNAGNVAFMGVFTSKEAAQDRCEHGKDIEFTWMRRGRVEEYETVWFAWTENTKIKFVVARRQVQETGEPQRLNPNQEERT